MLEPLIYLDYSATTPLDPWVLDQMLPYLREHFGNPSSQHRAGWQAQFAVEKARSSVAQLLGAQNNKEIIFTSGASEANSMAILGTLQALRIDQPQRRLHAMTSQVEHKSVLSTFEQLKDLGVEIDFLPVNSHGQVELRTLEKFRRPETVFMSFIWANNELGSLNPMKELAHFARQNNICFHSDATQACGKIPVNVEEIGVDLLSLSAHKMHGPKGVGALYHRHQGSSQERPLWPLIRGGSQEHGARAGTLNVPGIVGLGAAATLATEAQDSPTHSLETLTDQFLGNLQKCFPKVQLNGHPKDRLPGHLHLTFPGVRWDHWLPRLSHLCVSTTSACSSDSGQGSHVLKALGFSPPQMASSLRISLGKFTSHEEIQKTLQLFQRVFDSQELIDSSDS